MLEPVWRLYCSQPDCPIERWVPGGYLYYTRHTPRPEALLQMLWALQWLACSDERDKVFAALNYIDPAGTRKITIDYRRSLEDIATDVLRSEIMRDSSLGFLGYVRNTVSRLRNSKLPSWVPDWRHEHIEGELDIVSLPCNLGDVDYL